MVELLLWPFCAGIVLTGIHAYFGLHVIARGIIFVDLSLAQMAALGVTVAILAGHSVDSAAAYWYALVFAMSGALLFAAARRYEQAIQQEVVIGIVYAVCAALGVIVLDRAPQGAEHIKQILIGSILTVGREQVIHLAILYAAVGLVHWLLRRPMIRASFHAEAATTSGLNVFLWDAVFYASFALVVTSSVRIAGVLLVFSYLIVPAAIAGVLATRMPTRLVLAWVVGVVTTGVGLAASWTWDLPTGPAIVSAFGAATGITVALSLLRKSSPRQFGNAVALAVTLIGMLTFLFPQMDQPWLDSLEAALPKVQEVFLTDVERTTRLETADSIERAQTELTDLRARDQDVRWGTVEMPEEKRERLRQYIAARAEILAGDQLVMKEIRGHARARQRWLVALPLALLGCMALFLRRITGSRRKEKS